MIGQPKASPYSRARVASLAAVYVLMGIHIAHWKLAGKTLAPLELNEVLYTLHRGIVTAGFLFMAATLAGTLLLGRFFCGWACHLLALQDLCAWLLSKAGLRPPRFRSRFLGWLPFLLAFYLVVWPQLERLLQGRALPRLHIQGEASGWASFVTCDFSRNLPGPAIALLTFLVCGGLIVVLLGSRSFCSTVCPYGTLFRAADAAAPLRLVAAGDCRGCGRCTAICRSGVRVHEELARYGTIVDPHCIKDLDCLGSCPHQAIAYGAALPPLLRGLPAPLSSKRPFSLSFAEEAFLAATFLTAFLALRGLYDLVPLLLAAGLAVIAAFTGLLSLRLATRGNVWFQRWALRQDGRLTRMGRAAAFAGLASAGLTLHSGFVRYHAYRGESLYDRLSTPPAEPAAARGALEHLEAAYRWGLLRPLGLERKLAALHFLMGTGSEPRDSQGLLALGSILARLGRFQEAERLLRRCASLEPGSAVVYHNLAVVAHALGRDREAVGYYSRLLELRPNDLSAVLDRAILLDRLGNGRVTAPPR